MPRPLSQPPKLILSQCPNFGRRLRRIVDIPMIGVAGTLAMPDIVAVDAVEPLAVDDERFKLFMTSILFSMMFIFDGILVALAKFASECTKLRPSFVLKWQMVGAEYRLLFDFLLPCGKLLPPPPNVLVLRTTFVVAYAP